MAEMQHMSDAAEECGWGCPTRTTAPSRYGGVEVGYHFVRNNDNEKMSMYLNRYEITIYYNHRALTWPRPKRWREHREYNCIMKMLTTLRADQPYDLRADQPYDRRTS